MQHRDLLQAEVAQEIRQQRHLVLLVDGVAPDEVAALGEIRVRVGEAELHHPGRLVDRRSRHRGRAGEVADLDHDALVGDVFSRNVDGLSRVALGVLEDILQRPSLDAARRIDLVECQVEALLPLRAVLRVLAGERPADADQDRFLGLRQGRHGNERAARKGEEKLAAMQHDDGSWIATATIARRFGTKARFGCFYAASMSPGGACVNRSPAEPPCRFKNSGDASRARLRCPARLPGLG